MKCRLCPSHRPLHVVMQIPSKERGKAYDYPNTYLCRDCIEKLRKREAA